MKTLPDRSNPLFPRDYAFRDINLLASATENEESAVDGTLTGLQGWVSCSERATLKGVVRGVVATALVDIRNNPATLSLAETMGKNA